MRKEFCAWLEQYAGGNEKVVVITGDLGFSALEPVRERIGARFVNAGVAEQNMVSLGAALASEGLLPFCYSIAPFAVFRPAEQWRLDVCLHRLNVKLVGNGGGYGYGIMGATHHALEDLAVVSSFQSMACFIPTIGQDVAATCDAMVAYDGPSYLRLGFAQLPEGFRLVGPFRPIRQVVGPMPAQSPELTVVALGPMVQNVLAAASLENQVDFFGVSQLPLPELSEELRKSLARTRRLLVVEEHVERGGLAEHLALHLLREGLSPRLWSRAAKGYPSKRYGSPAFHQRESGLDGPGLVQAMRSIIDG